MIRFSYASHPQSLLLLLAVYRQSKIKEKSIVGRMKENTLARVTLSDDFSFDFFATGSIGSGGRTFKRGSSGTSERDLPERDGICFADISVCESSIK